MLGDYELCGCLDCKFLVNTKVAEWRLLPSEKCKLNVEAKLKETTSNYNQYKIVHY